MSTETGTAPEIPDRNLALELVRVTEAAAMAASRWVGFGDKNGADINLVVDAMNADIVVRRLEVTLAVANRGLFGLERVLVIWVGAHLPAIQSLTAARFIQSAEMPPTKSSAIRNQRPSRSRKNARNGASSSVGSRGPVSFPISSW